ncbi:DNA modification methylase [Candidatus Nomurabacteria bacterium RIFOXYC2_FULL_36_19]|uniref:DNA modification methylase n=1 Tax=Candidatus Nomurabacteria bacterium RIFOXYC2_FULL_36_19 TaxID=1801806 RepID=A0A1F6YW56_9BACT|nr:MAG: DNA modification methylase [Candidatus Nomurabacteria bacterium RIFOXYC2_FULL_36_19]
MTIQDLIKIYDTKKKKYGIEAYRHISNVLKEAKEQHGRDFTGNDHEQSWRAFKGKNLEKLIEYIITDEVHALNLQVVNGNSLERTNGSNLSKELSVVKRNLTVDYGEFGLHLPDVDLIIYDPKTSKVVAVLSSKVTLRERIAQTGYWKIKLASDKATKHIKVYFVTPDEDGTLTIKKPTKKGRAIVEVDTDGSYVLSETNIEESDKVKMFDKFIDDLKKLLK